MEKDIIHNKIISLRLEMLEFLQNSIRIPSVSGNEEGFVRFIQQWAEDYGFKTDLFETGLADYYDFFISTPKHIPFFGRPSLVVSLPGKGKGKSLMFNAHADTVSAGEIKDWDCGPFSGNFTNGRVYGRGACDAKGPLISALWAMNVVGKLFPDGVGGDLMLELIPGEEDCVGLGTLGSIKRGYIADASIVLEPTENYPRCASRGGLRFKVTVRGKAIHGTLKWKGKDAIRSARKVLDSLDELENRWNDKNSDILFRPYPIARPVTVDKINGGLWQGMCADICKCEGYFELLPDDDLVHWRQVFIDELVSLLPGEDIEIKFSENYYGHKTSSASDLCRIAESVCRDFSTEITWNGWSAFNSGCEAGVRARLNGTPTIVWGAGSIEQAHSPNEFIEFSSVELCAELLAQTALKWIENSNYEGFN